MTEQLLGIHRIGGAPSRIDGAGEPAEIAHAATSRRSISGPDPRGRPAREVRLPDDDWRPLVVNADEFGARVRACLNGDQYASWVGFREERVARNEVAAREINEAIEETDTRPASSFIDVLCECGVEDCERVLAITRPVYERVRSDPRQFVILPSHLIAEVEDVVLESDRFLVVAKRGGTPEDIAVRTDPRR